MTRIVIKIAAQRAGELEKKIRLVWGFELTSSLWRVILCVNLRMQIWFNSINQVVIVSLIYLASAKPIVLVSESNIVKMWPITELPMNQ